MNFLDQAIEATNARQSEKAVDAIQARENANVVPINHMEQTGGDYLPRDTKGKELFTVEKMPVTTPKGVMEDRGLLFVGDRCINTTLVGKNYEIHQPKEIYQSFSKIAKETGLAIGPVVSNPHTGGLLLSAKYASCDIVGEHHDVHFTFYSAHDGSSSSILTMDALRMVCLNQVPLIQSNKKRHIFKKKHLKNALDITMMEKAVSEAPKALEVYANKALNLYESKFSYDDFVEFYIAQYDIDREAPRFDSKINRMKEIYYKAEGQKIIPNNSGYKALQALTYHNTHEVKETVNQVENRHIKNADKSVEIIEALVELVA